MLLEEGRPELRYLSEDLAGHEPPRPALKSITHIDQKIGGTERTYTPRTARKAFNL